MKVLKIPAKGYRDLEYLLRLAGAVKDKQAFPQYLYVNKFTMNKIKSEVTKEFKKQYPYLNKRKISSAVGLYMLSYAPVLISGNDKGLNNLVLVDDIAIQNALDIEYTFSTV